MNMRFINQSSHRDGSHVIPAARGVPGDGTHVARGAGSIHSQERHTQHCLHSAASH